jgi:hypothetical protein
MTKLTTGVLLALLLTGPFTIGARATTITAASCDAAYVQTAINSASSGDTVNVPSGTCTWSSQVSIAKGITLQGQTVCTGSGDPNGGTSGVVSCTDKTNVTLAVARALSVGPASGQVTTITGFTFISGVAIQPGIGIGSNHGQVNFRFHHNHLVMAVSGAQTLYAAGGGGLIDHNYFQDTVTSGTGAVPLDFGGDFATRGYQNWHDPTNFGSNEAIYAEDNYYTTSHPNTEGFFDAYYGAKLVVRYNTIVGNELGGWHGTDSGFADRSVVYGEVYGNAVINVSGSFGVMNTRGGSLLFWNNEVGGVNAGGIDLQYYRYSMANPYSGAWGTAGAGLNWVIPDITFWNDWPSKPISLNASDFVASRSYGAQAVVAPLSNNGGQSNFQLTNGPCTSGSYPGSWNQVWGATTTDSNGCVWRNVGGITTPSAVSAHGWCAANPDTICSADSTCSALQTGDTCSRYLDAYGGYPFRDQPGRVHNQALAPNYEWGNSGAGLPPTILGTDSATNRIILANRDYYNYASSFNGTSGTGSGTLSNRPSTCTTGVAYWATDQGSWNQSGNGGSQGVLYQCVAPNTWAVYYTPYAYPHPLAQKGTGGTGTAPPTNLQLTVR